MKRPGIIGSPDPPPGLDNLVVNSMRGALGIRNDAAAALFGGK